MSTLVALCLGFAVLWIVIGFLLLRWSGSGDVIAMLHYNHPVWTNCVVVAVIVLWPLAHLLFWSWIGWNRLYMRRYPKGKPKPLDPAVNNISGSYYLVTTPGMLQASLRHSTFRTETGSQIKQASVPTEIEYPCLVTITRNEAERSLDVSVISIENLRHHLERLP